MRYYCWRGESGSLTAQIIGYELIEFLPRIGLFRTDSSSRDVRQEIVLASDWRAKKMPEHGKLADMRKCISDWALN